MLDDELRELAGAFECGAKRCRTFHATTIADHHVITSATPLSFRACEKSLREAHRPQADIVVGTTDLRCYVPAAPGDSSFVRMTIAGGLRRGRDRGHDRTGGHERLPHIPAPP